MDKGTPKLPKTGGAKMALEAIKKFRNQQPSDRLVKIISEYGNEGEVEKEKAPRFQGGSFMTESKKESIRLFLKESL